jgi:hypothetical protein
MADTPKAHHYIPRFYLEGFLSAGFPVAKRPMLWVYEGGRSPWCASPENIAFEKHLYTLPSKDDAFFVEIFLGRLESSVAPLLRRTGDGELCDDREERSLLCAFMAMLATRTPFFFHLVKRQAAGSPGELSRILRAVEEDKGYEPGWTARAITEDFIDKDSPTQGRFKTWTVHQMFDVGRAVHQAIQEMNWMLIESDWDEGFVTSDNPVCLFNPGSLGSPSPWKLSKETHFFFPINRHVCLMGHTSREGSKFRTSGFGVRMINKLIISKAFRFVYATVKSSALETLINNSVAARMKY